VLTTCQPSTVWCSRERLPAAAAQPAKVHQSCSATDFIYIYIYIYIKSITGYIILNQNSQLKGHDVHACTEATCDIDHHLVRAKILIPYFNNCEARKNRENDTDNDTVKVPKYRLYTSPCATLITLDVHKTETRCKRHIKAIK
jgi:hypothetical protein